LAIILAPTIQNKTNEEYSMSDYKGPLSRFTVLDLTRVRSGPTAVRQFADWGANVIKIEAPEKLDKTKAVGGTRNGPDFQSIQRNKRGVTLNLQDPASRDILLKMVEKADVVVENFRPDIKKRFGITYEDLRAVNKGIVLLSISGFGQDGPYKNRPGFDQIAQGMGGLMSVTGLPGQGPLRVGLPIADLTSGLYGALGVMTALLDREVTGEGQWVDTSLLQATVAMMDFQVARYLMKGEVPKQAGNFHPTSIPTGVFKTADGHVNIAASTGIMYERLCELFEAPELLEDPRYATPELRSENRDTLCATIEEHTQKWKSQELIDAMNDAGVPCGPIYSVDQMYEDPQVKHLGLRHPIKHPVLGDFDVLPQGVNLSKYKPRTGMPTPERGQHNDEVLHEFGFSDEEIASFRDKELI
jgi:crotonobetainyl-CoA:carnitine CoA-transferase CaiB-like acyl-CoA transferase